MYSLTYSKQVMRKDIPALSTSVAKRIKQNIELKLVHEPFKFGKPLRSNLSGYYRLRVGDYRVVYEIDDQNKEVYISAIKHRNKIYD